MQLRGVVGHTAGNYKQGENPLNVNAHRNVQNFSEIDLM